MSNETEKENESPRRSRSDLLPELLLTPVAVSALALSATGMWNYAERALGFTGGRQLVAVIAIDAAMFVCAVLARRNKLATGSRGAYAPVMWALAAVSGVLASLEAATLEGSLGRAAFPFIAAVLWELLTSYRHREAQPGPNRAVGMVRWLHPAERVRVMLELATDAGMSETTATHRVRVRAAAWRLHRIAQLPDKGVRLRLANRRAGLALSRAGTRDPVVHRDVVVECYEIASPRRVGQETVKAAMEAATVTPAQVFDRVADHTADRADHGELTTTVRNGHADEGSATVTPADQADQADHRGSRDGHDVADRSARHADRHTGRDGQRRSRDLPDPTKHMGSAWEVYDRLTAQGQRVNRDAIGDALGVSNTGMRRAIWSRIKAGDRIVDPERVTAVNGSH